jgi:hypothetical protein
MKIYYKDVKHMESNSIISMVVRPVPKSQSEPSIGGETVRLMRKVFQAATIVGSPIVSIEAMAHPRPIATNKDGSLKLSKTGELAYANNKEFAAGVRTVKTNLRALMEEGADTVFAANVEAKKAMDIAMVEAAKPLIAAENDLIAKHNAAVKASAEKAEYDRLVAVEAIEAAKKEAERITAMEAELNDLRVKVATIPATDVPADKGEEVKGNGRKKVAVA